MSKNKKSNPIITSYSLIGDLIMLNIRINSIEITFFYHFTLFFEKLYKSHLFSFLIRNIFNTFSMNLTL